MQVGGESSKWYYSSRDDRQIAEGILLVSPNDSMMFLINYFTAYCKATYTCHIDAWSSRQNVSIHSYNVRPRALGHRFSFLLHSYLDHNRINNLLIGYEHLKSCKAE